MMIYNCHHHHLCIISIIITIVKVDVMIESNSCSQGLIEDVGVGWVEVFFNFELFRYFKSVFKHLNIARGTTDPEIDSETWTKLGNNMAPLALIANLDTRWSHLTFSHLITFLTR